MSRFGAIRCFECGKPIDDKYEAFSYMRALIEAEVAQTTHIDKRILDSSSTRNLDRVFEALRFRPEKDCCRTRFLTTVLPVDLETRGTQLGMM
jgi:DNA-directed RNA polymerase subunit N (RpoN/RPB10)